jgi:hypothetical protein
MKRIAILTLMLLAASCAIAQLNSSESSDLSQSTYCSYPTYPPQPCQSNATVRPGSIAIGPGAALHFVGTYSVFIGRDAGKNIVDGECELVVKPIYPSDISAARREYHDRHFDPYVSLEGLEPVIEKHCGWPRGTIRAAWLHALKMGGNTERKAKKGKS